MSGLTGGEMPANGPIHDVIPQFYSAGRRVAPFRDFSSRPAAFLIPHAANKSPRRRCLCAPVNSNVRPQIRVSAPWNTLREFIQAHC
jgi:hypothetical protein